MVERRFSHGPDIDRASTELRAGPDRKREYEYEYEYEHEPDPQFPSNDVHLPLIK